MNDKNTIVNDRDQLAYALANALKERDEARAELEEYRSIAESIGAKKAVSEKEKAIHERDKLREQRDRLAEALTEIIRLGEGLPDDAEEVRIAREALQSLTPNADVLASADNKTTPKETTL